ncbi:hypothetical protein H4Q26_002307 [Puccinia striiformis f. sp. tritici PST-130]|nr:hypothetical protein H4Q26_002307 [Puccinia striiformis f. sp. tritici PST-130]
MYLYSQSELPQLACLQPAAASSNAIRPAPPADLQTSVHKPFQINTQQPWEERTQSFDEQLSDISSSVKARASPPPQVGKYTRPSRKTVPAWNCRRIKSAKGPLLAVFCGITIKPPRF